jgi:GNAT superfamily N-acetyltransferase
MTPSYRIRQATQLDADIIAGHRVCMFRDMGEVPTDELATDLFKTSSSALSQVLGDGTYVGWLAIDSGDRVIGGVGAHVKSQLPRVSHHGARLVTAPAPLVVNMYMEPAWRGQGIARALMTTLMKWATAQGFDRVLLHASDAGRPLYQSLGFVPTNEMRWSPRPGDKPGIETFGEN